MNTTVEPIAELSHRARNLLIHELGAVDAMRFLNQFAAGRGNYTDDRAALFKDDSVKSVIAEITASRKHGQT